MKYDVLLDFEYLNEYKDYYLVGKDGEHIKTLSNFSNINIFIGPNNSGKSRFLRSLMKQEKINALNNLEEIIDRIQRCNIIINDLDIDWVRPKNRYTVGGLPKIVEENNKVRLYSIDDNKVKILNNDISSLIDVNLSKLDILKELTKNGYSHYIDNNDSSNSPSRVSKPDSNLLDQLFDNLSDLKELSKVIFLGKQTNYYIPTLRTAHSLFREESKEQFKDYSKIKTDIFAETITKNYNLSKLITKQNSQKKDSNSDTKKIHIITGLNLYYDIINARNGLKSEREKFNNFEKFIGRNFFNDGNIDIVASFNINENSTNNELINIFINGQSRDLHDLGDGVQSLIILMYGIFIAPPETLIFIDEPELNLHPGMQRLFLEQITSNPDLTKKNLKYVIVTHSNHLLDLTLEKDNISIFSFSFKKESLVDEKGKSKFLIKNVNSGDNELLRNLGVNNSSVFLANSSIWVEGISDRNYIKAFLHAYCNNQDEPLPKEDIDFAFLEYAGSNLEHYDFTSKPEKEKINAFALNNKIFILSDKDLGKEDKHKIFQKIAKGRNNIVYKTTEEYREIENLLSIEVWKKTLDDYYSKKIKSEKRISKFQSELNQKLDNIKLENYKDKYIGEFLSEIKKEVTDLRKIWSGAQPPTTLNIKAEFSRKVLQMTLEGKLTWNDFSKNSRVRTLTKEIYDFIKSQS
ncbi:AAA family ATPase [uncultured Aquimarina sp.]|uniref:AAA family ATPase n=1 Tax=uncultured Aquimarina sp. TaxID=575652 RepID=UPI00260F1F68|nr:AAA family ATPase [uncultured Aquimarina sp.]